MQPHDRAGRFHPNAIFFCQNRSTTAGQNQMILLQQFCQNFRLKPSETRFPFGFKDLPNLTRRPFFNDTVAVDPAPFQTPSEARSDARLSTAAISDECDDHIGNRGVSFRFSVVLLDRNLNHNRFALRG